MPRMTAGRWNELERAAIHARKRAYAPYSRFRVGAALLCGDGTIVSGCNVENATYGLTICAERTAFASAIAQGQSKFDAIAILTGSAVPGSPCGMCIQTMVEFCEELHVLLFNTKGVRERTRLSKLAPRPFRWKGAGTNSKVKK